MKGSAPRVRRCSSYSGLGRVRADRAMGSRESAREFNGDSGQSNGAGYDGARDRTSRPQMTGGKK